MAGRETAPAETSQQCGLDELMGRVGGAGVRAVVTGRLAVQELLDHGREGPGTDGMQHLLAAARCDAGAVRDDVYDYVVEQLGGPGGGAGGGLSASAVVTAVLS